MTRIETHAFARAGLLGNPSDGFGGKTISFSIGQFYATAWIEPANELEIVPQKSDLNVFDSIESLAFKVERNGYYGAPRLQKAAIKKFFDYCRANLSNLKLNRNFRIGYASSIPRGVGLAGSSAIIVATLRALERFYDVEIDSLVLPSLALSVEADELKIPAGLQDRVIQCIQGQVYMDFSDSASSDHLGFRCGSYETLERNSTFDQLYVAYGDEAGQPTEVLHNDLRNRFVEKDPQVMNAMDRFADLAQQGRGVLLAEDTHTLNNLIDANFDLRESICSLHPVHVQMIQTARSASASAKYCGSGGAIVGMCRDDKFDSLVERMDAIRCKVMRPTWVEPFSN